MRNFLHMIFRKKAEPVAPPPGFYNHVEDLVLHDEFNFPSSTDVRVLQRLALEHTAELKRAEIMVKAEQPLGPLTAQLYLDNYGLRIDCFTREDSWQPALKRAVHFRDLPKEFLMENAITGSIDIERMPDCFLTELKKKGVSFVNQDAAKEALTHILATWFTEEILRHDQNHRIFHNPSPTESCVESPSTQHLLYH